MPGRTKRRRKKGGSKAVSKAKLRLQRELFKTEDDMKQEEKLVEHYEKLAEKVSESEEWLRRVELNLSRKMRELDAFVCSVASKQLVESGAAAALKRKQIWDRRFEDTTEISSVNKSDSDSRLDGTSALKAKKGTNKKNANFDNNSNQDFSVSMVHTLSLSNVHVSRSMVESVSKAAREVGTTLLQPIYISDLRKGVRHTGWFIEVTVISGRQDVSSHDGSVTVLVSDSLGNVIEYTVRGLPSYLCSKWLKKGNELVIFEPLVRVYSMFGAYTNGIYDDNPFYNLHCKQGHLSTMMQSMKDVTSRKKPSSDVDLMDWKSDKDISFDFVHSSFIINIPTETHIFPAIEEEKQYSFLQPRIVCLNHESEKKVNKRMMVIRKKLLKGIEKRIKSGLIMNTFNNDMDDSNDEEEWLIWKQRGMDCFNEAKHMSDFNWALFCFDKSLRFLCILNDHFESIRMDDDSNHSFKVKLEMIKILNNIGLCFNRQKEWLLSLKSCRLSYQMYQTHFKVAKSEDPNDLKHKVVFRLAESLYNCGHYQKCMDLCNDHMNEFELTPLLLMISKPKSIADESILKLRKHALNFDALMKSCLNRIKEQSFDFENIQAFFKHASLKHRKTSKIATFIHDDLELTMVNVNKENGETIDNEDEMDDLTSKYEIEMIRCVRLKAKNVIPKDTVILVEKPFQVFDFPEKYRHRCVELMPVTVVNDGSDTEAGESSAKMDGSHDQNDTDVQKPVVVPTAGETTRARHKIDRNIHELAQKTSAVRVLRQRLFDMSSLEKSRLSLLCRATGHLSADDFPDPLVFKDLLNGSRLDDTQSSDHDDAGSDDTSLSSLTKKSTCVQLSSLPVSAMDMFRLFDEHGLYVESLNSFVSKKGVIRSSGSAKSASSSAVSTTASMSMVSGHRTQHRWCLACVTSLLNTVESASSKIEDRENCLWVGLEELILVVTVKEIAKGDLLTISKSRSRGSSSRNDKFASLDDGDDDEHVSAETLDGTGGELGEK